MRHNNTLRLSTLALSCGVAMMAINQTARASGSNIPELNTTGLALSNAMVANPDSLGAMAYNAAAMSFHEGSSLSVGTLLIDFDMSVDTGSGTIDSDANGTVAIPDISAHRKLNEDWAIGFSFSVPFGVVTEWPVGTFDGQYPTPAPNPYYPAQGPALLTSTIPTKTKLEIPAVSPSIAYQINENTSLSAGIDYYWLKKVILNGDINTGSPGSNPSANIEGDGHGVGFSLGLMAKQGAWSFGGNYHTAVNIPIYGTASLPAGTLPSFMSNDARADLGVPWRLQLGVRNQTIDKLAIEFDVTRTGWSAFDKIEVEQDQYGVNIATNINKWKDTNAYRLGASYDISPSTQLRVGYTFDETPQGDKYFNPRIPDADRQLFSMGIGHTLCKDWTLNAGYMYAKLDSRTINSSTAAGAGVETNGTKAVNGTYDSSVHIFGLGITKHFM